VLASNFDRSSAFQAGFVYSCFSPQVIDLRLRKNIALQAKAVSQLRSKKNSFCKVVNCKSNGNGATNCKSFSWRRYSSVPLPTVIHGTSKYLHQLREIQ